MRIFIPLALCLTLAPSTLTAEGTRFELTPTISYRSQGEFDLETIDVVSDEAELKEGAAFGLNLDIELNRVLRLELLANRQDTELIEDGGLFGSEQTVGDLEVTYVHIGLLAQFGRGQVQPFVVGSLGVAHLAPDIAGLSDEDRPSGSFGGGVKIRFNDHLGLRLEARTYYVDLDEDDDDHDRYEDEDSLVQAEASLGLIIGF